MTDSFQPPASVQAAAARSLRKRAEKPPSDRGMTPVGLARARDLSNGSAVSLDTVKRMKAYFDRHQVDKQGSSWNEYGKGRQAWDGWGGDAGYAWAKSVLKREESRSASLANARRSVSEMDDDQRRAVMAKMGGGGRGRSGGYGAQSGSGNASRAATSSGKKPKSYGPNDPIPSFWKAAWSGFKEGFAGGSSIAANTISMGLTDKLGLTESSKYAGDSDYDFSRKAAVVSREAALAAAGIGLTSKLSAAWNGTQIARTGVGKAAAPLMAVGGFATQSEINDYRARNPTIDPKLDKALAMASQLAGYIGAMGAVGTIGKTAGMALKAIPTSKTLTAAAAAALKKEGINLTTSGRLVSADAISALGRAQQGIKLLDKKLAEAGAYVSSKSPAVVNKLAKAAHNVYSKAADFTGSSIKELGAAAKAPKQLTKASKLTKLAADNRKQADTIKTIAAYKEPILKKNATDALDAAHKASISGSPDAGNLYRKAADAFWAVDDSALQSRAAAKKLTNLADKLDSKAAKIKDETLAGLKKAAYVAAGLTGKNAWEENKIDSYQKQVEDSIRSGEAFNYPVDSERGVLGTVTAALVGMTGNPVEKQTRFGEDAYLASVGAYRAGYKAINEARDRGELTQNEATAALNKLAETKPKNMAGKTLWSFAPAAAAYVNWKVGDAISKAKRSEIDQRAAGSYIDGDTIHLSSGKQIRLVDINTPEVAHPGHNDPKHPERTTGEYLGDQAAAYAAGLVKDGQYVRVVTDSNKSAAGSTYGRDVRTIETLPKPFDNLLRIPYLGKFIPAKEFQQEMIRAGMGDIDYRELTKYKGDNLEKHDKARAKAQAEKLGIWSDEAAAAYADYAAKNPAFKPWVGTEQTVAERQADYFRKTEGRDLPPETIGEITTPLGMGLMASGNSGIFGQMPKSGNLSAQSYNAVLAVLGAMQYNEQARRASTKRKAKKPKSVKTDYEKRMEESRKKYITQ